MTDEESHAPDDEGHVTTRNMYLVAVWPASAGSLFHFLRRYEAKVETLSGVRCMSRRRAITFSQKVQRQFVPLWFHAESLNDRLSHAVFEV